MRPNRGLSGALIGCYLSALQIYMTYPALKLADDQILDMLCAARRTGVTTMVHCEVRFWRFHLAFIRSQHY